MDKQYFEVVDANLFYNGMIGTFVKEFPSGVVQLELGMNEDLGGVVRINFYPHQIDNITLGRDL